MLTNLIKFLSQHFSQEIVIAIVAALPISELRGAIPLGINIWKMPPLKVFLIAVGANFFLVIPFLIFLKLFTRHLLRYKLAEKFLNWWFERTRKRAAIVEKYEALGLCLFVAIPLPLTGAWSGCVAAYLLNIRFCYAAPAIFFGVLIAGIIVTILSTTAGLIKI